MSFIIKKKVKKIKIKIKDKDLPQMTDILLQILPHLSRGSPITERKSLQTNERKVLPKILKHCLEVNYTDTPFFWRN
jgi:hypothetical protein